MEAQWESEYGCEDCALRGSCDGAVGRGGSLG